MGDSNLVGMDECPERLAVGPHLREFYRGREGMEAVLTKLVNSLNSSLHP